MPLTSLALSHCAEVRDLSPLKGLPLTVLLLDDTPVRDLEPVKNLPLKRLYIYQSGVTDVKALQAMQLEDIRVDPRVISQGLNILRDMKSLKTVGLDHWHELPAAEFWTRYDKGELKVDASPWERSVAAMPANEQVTAVIARLKELNPGFDGKVTPTVENDVVTGLEFQTDQVRDISPVRSVDPVAVSRLFRHRCWPWSSERPRAAARVAADELAVPLFAGLRPRAAEGHGADEP